MGPWPVRAVLRFGNRWPFVAVVALALLASRAFAAPLNLLLITADDLGLQLGCYGETGIATPHLDALAEQGVLFERAYVTQASCSPSRSSMLTGLYPHANGQYGLSNPRTDFILHEAVRDQTLPTILKRHGYRTGIIGKLHVAPTDAFEFDVATHPAPRDIKTTVEDARTFWDAQDDSPFFLMVNFFDPHVLREGSIHYPPSAFGYPETPLEAQDAALFPFQQVDTAAQIERTTGYLNAVMRLDAGVGLLMEALREAGHDQETLIVFVSDHGPPFDRGKTSCYEAGLHVPMLLKWPGIAQPLRHPALVSTVDILPTLLDAAGVLAPERLHGKSLRPLLADREAKLRDVLGGEFNYHGTKPFFPRRSIRNERFKLIHNVLSGKAKPILGVDGDKGYRGSQTPRFNGTVVARAFQTLAHPPEFELYDLERDPWEFVNLADDPRFAEDLATLKVELLAWQTETADPLLTPTGLQEMAEHEGRARTASTRRP